MQSSSAAISQVDDGGSSRIKLCSEEVNILIYLYLLESNFTHTAFTLLSESALPSTSLFQTFNPSYPTSSARKDSSTRTNGTTKPATPTSDAFGSSAGKIPRGELIRKLWKALRWEEIERHAAGDLENGSLACRSPFHLLIPHTCSAEEAADGIDTATSPPPSKRPEAFPQPTVSAKVATSGDVDRQTLPVESQGSSPLAIGKGKRKGIAESPPPVPNDINRDDSVGEEQESAPVRSVPNQETSLPRDSDSGPAVKRQREDDDKTPDTTTRPRAPSSRSKSQNSSSKAAPVKSIRGFPATESGGGCWMEHRDAVTCLAWNPKDKDSLVTGSSDGSAKLWDFFETEASSGHALQLSKKPVSISHKSIDSGKKAVTALGWHPDGTVFATASDGVGRLFTPSGQLQGILTYGRGTINSLKFNPSGNSLLAAKDDFTVCLFVLDFDLKSPKQLSFEAHSKEVNDVDWLDDDVFASGGNDHHIFIFRANDRRPRFTLKGHTDDVTRVKWSPPQSGGTERARLLASVSDDGTIMVWKLPHYPADRGTVSRSLSPSKQPKDRESDDDFLVVAPGSEYCINRLAVVSGGTENKRMSTLEWSPASRDGRMIVAAGGQDSTVKLFDAVSGECLQVLAGLESGTGSIAFSPLGFGRPLGVVAGGGWNGKLVVWDVETGDVLKECEIEEEPDRQSARDKPMMTAMAWRNDGQQLALGLHNKTLLSLYVGSLL
ncbi:F-box-like/WD repeat-containing protein TBL1XR1-B [Vanrija pseudolonga]|uniref:F-box-like/WD repeat-containing protein TBL1XR1-B n=1 Tax=Vanrija pseudolonga TaxID=143232 RepID=A0AAF1BFA4_9TREE|nr:F-box-like/WD repeat-containing protein TBL1XR1-B [Vanrija pseudolonga]